MTDLRQRAEAHRGTATMLVNPEELLKVFEEHAHALSQLREEKNKDLEMLAKQIISKNEEINSLIEETTKVREELNQANYMLDKVRAERDAAEVLRDKIQEEA